MKTAAKEITHQNYLAALQPGQRAALEKLRNAIKSAAPKAEECISYGLCAYRLDRPLVAFAATKTHCAFYLMSGSTIDTHKDLLKNYDTSKGTIRFSPDKPLPASLVKKLVNSRIKENAQRL